MNLLALETSTPHCTVAILKDNKLFEKESFNNKDHTTYVIPMINAVLEKSGLELGDIDGIGFSAGPGSFTGLRISCAVAQGIGFVKNIPVVPVSTMQALALRQKERKVVVCLDARAGEIYFAAYEWDQKICNRAQQPKIYDPQKLPELKGAGWVGCGEAFSTHQGTLKLSLPFVRVNLNQIPHASEVAVLARQELAKGGNFQAQNAKPFYIRQNVARKIDEQKKNG